MRPGSASRSCRASSSIRCSASASPSPCGHEVQLHLAGRAQDRGLRVLEARVDGCGHLVDAALGHAGDPQHPPPHDPRRAGARPKPRQHLLVEHRLHLAGRTGQAARSCGPGARAAGPAPCRARSGARQPLRSRRPASGSCRTSAGRSARSARAAQGRSRGPGVGRAPWRQRRPRVSGRPRSARGRRWRSRRPRARGPCGTRTRAEPGRRRAWRAPPPRCRRRAAAREPQRVGLGAQRPEQLAADRQQLGLQGVTRRARPRARRAAAAARRSRPRRRRP